MDNLSSWLGYDTPQSLKRRESTHTHIHRHTHSFPPSNTTRFSRREGSKEGQAAVLVPTRDPVLKQCIRSHALVGPRTYGWVPWHTHAQRESGVGCVCVWKMKVRSAWSGVSRGVEMLYNTCHIYIQVTFSLYYS